VPKQLPRPAVHPRTKRRREEFGRLAALGRMTNPHLAQVDRLADAVFG
jgi:hypothetical protein